MVTPHLIFLISTWITKQWKVARIQEEFNSPSTAQDRYIQTYHLPNVHGNRIISYAFLNAERGG